MSIDVLNVTWEGQCGQCGTKHTVELDGATPKAFTRQFTRPCFNCGTSLAGQVIMKATWVELPCPAEQFNRLKQGTI